MKKVLSILLVLTMVFSLAGCGASTAPGEALNGAGGIKGDAMFDGAVDGDIGAMAPEAAPGEPGGDVIDVPEQKPQYQSGTLTAGEWSDLENLEFWTKLLNRNDWYQLMEERNLFANKVVKVTAKYESDMYKDGVRAFNTVVQLLNANNEVLYTARTNMQGEAYLFYNLQNNKEEAVAIKIGDTVTQLEGKTELEVMVEKGDFVPELDIMLMVDTTGSMSDELTYLQKELEDVLTRSAASGNGYAVRLSVNFYRDEDDDYVVREFDFTDKIDDAITQLNAQRTDGGGDYPEAVHKALDSILQNHEWRDGAVKLCFFVLDAPPHSESEIKGINAQMTKTVKALAAEGVRLIPIASSGVNTETEFLLRSWAAMTGGTYTFLTDHSGVGNDHLEPTIGDYEVEKLNDLMIRLIQQYCGIVESSLDTQQ